LHRSEAVAEHSEDEWNGSLSPPIAVGEVARDVLAAVRRLVGPVEIDPRPQETPWKTRSTRTPSMQRSIPCSGAYFAAATRAAQVLAALRRHTAAARLP